MVPFENQKDLEPLKNNELYRHYKNVYYKTLFDDSHINTKEKFVIYTNDEYKAKSIYLARPYEMFHRK